MRWIIPYIDQPLSFWEAVEENYSRFGLEVYFPLSADIIGSGEPTQPSRQLDAFLRHSPFPCSALLNSLTLPRPVEIVTPAVIETLRMLVGEYNIASATVTNLTLARRIREKLPDLPLTASCLMQVSKPNQVEMMDGVFDNLVPSTCITRDLPALKALRKAFKGRIRLIVNEGCLPGCVYRVQHFHEMGNDWPHPLSLCAELLAKKPWLRLTGGWVLPQHLHLYEGVYDDLKLAGRVTLSNPKGYLRVLRSYVNRLPLTPDNIGCGPASVLEPLEITEEFFANTLTCGHVCHDCTFCRDYYAAAKRLLREKK